jgi:hypothetical protein
MELVSFVDNACDDYNLANCEAQYSSINVKTHISFKSELSQATEKSRGPQGRAYGSITALLNKKRLCALPL